MNPFVEIDCKADHAGVVQCSWLVFRRCPFQVSAITLAILTEVFIGFHYSLPTDNGIIPHLDHKCLLLIWCTHPSFVWRTERSTRKLRQNSQLSIWTSQHPKTSQKHYHFSELVIKGMTTVSLESYKCYFFKMSPPCFWNVWGHSQNSYMVMLHLYCI
jgi:hypothetical protein